MAAIVPSLNLLDDDVCPVCRVDRYLNPHMKLLVGPCLHKMCESCIDRIFNRGPAPCPICRQTLRKINFVSQTFEDLTVEKEVRIRKKVQKFFNKRQTDFPSLRAYNDYLEEVEVITFNLVNDVDVEETQANIERFAQENKDLIATNAVKEINEQKLEGLREEQDKRERKLQHETYLRSMDEEQEVRKAEREEMINELATSDKSASSIAKAITLKRSSMRKQQEAFAITAPLSAELSYLEQEARRHRLMKAEEEEEQAMMIDDGFAAYENEYMDIDTFELKLVYEDPFTQPILNDTRASAGGFHVQLTFKSGLEAAYSDLLVPPL